MIVSDDKVDGWIIIRKKRSGQRSQILKVDLPERIPIECLFVYRSHTKTFCFDYRPDCLRESEDWEADSRQLRVFEQSYKDYDVC